MNNNNGKLVAIVDRFENGKAVLRFSDNQELIISKKFLHPQVKTGEAINLEFLTDQEETRRRENLAKAILQEIIEGK